MSSLVFRFAAILALPIVSQVAISQSALGTDRDEIKHVDVPMPMGIVRGEAREIDKDWTPPIVHLKGNVYVRIYTATKAPRGAVNVRADEVDINQTTGEISPRGNVRLIVDDIK
jgi:lipopolysaccharide assembly outer membrane protein LptD (OstA)